MYSKAVANIYAPNQQQYVCVQALHACFRLLNFVKLANRNIALWR